jgi:RNA polymerase sigma factor (sigma-70 family)
MLETADHELLQQYAREGSEAAFARLVARHVNLVYSAALRKTRDIHAAEEVTQAVFIILARQAGALRQETILSGWLYQTARLTAINYLRTEMRRARREQEAYVQSLSNEPESEIWKEIVPFLEDAMGKLSEKDRNAIVLRFFERKNFQEVGAAFGASENAAKKRVAHALEKLRRIFLKRGVASTTAIIAAAMSAHSVQAAPAMLVTSATAAGIAKGAAAGGSTLTLIEGALKHMAWAKAKTTVVAGILILSTAATATLAIKQLSSQRREAPSRIVANSLGNFTDQMRRQPGGALTLEAAVFLKSLNAQGRLPGFPPNERSAIDIHIHNLVQDRAGVWQFSSGADGDTYPVTRTLRARKAGAGWFLYIYSAEKASMTASWRLQKAWRTDTNGLVVEEFPVP